MSLRRTGSLALLLVAGCQALPPAEGARAFDWTHGLWQGTRRSVADGARAPMTLRVEALPTGAGQMRSLEVGAGDDRYRGFAVQQWDSGRGVWLWRYSNRVTRAAARYECREVRDDGRYSLWRSVSIGRSRESRLESEHLSDGTWRRSMSVSTDGGRTWTGLWVDELRPAERPGT